MDIKPTNGAAPLFDVAILLAWPTGYEHGRFRLLHDGVLLFAEGKPPLKIDEMGRLLPLKGGRC